MDELSFQHYLLGLIAVANNIPAIPFFLELCEGLSPKEQHKLSIIATITSFITMLTAMIGCPWVDPSKPEYLEHHDPEWGVPVHDDRRLFEFLSNPGIIRNRAKIWGYH